MTEVMHGVSTVVYGSTEWDQRQQGERKEKNESRIYGFTHTAILYTTEGAQVGVEENAKRVALDAQSGNRV